MNSWEDYIDWQEVLLGALGGALLAILAGFVIEMLLLIQLSDFVQAVITFLPASFWAGYRARRGHPIVNALCAGIILFLISSVVFGFVSGLAFPKIGAWLIQGAIIATISVMSGVIAGLFREEIA